MKMTDMKIFTVEFDHPDGEDTVFNIIAEDPVDAVRHYLSAALEERIPMDKQDIRDAGFLKVTRIADLNQNPVPGLIAWENTGYVEVQAGPLLDELEAAGPGAPG